MYDATYNALHPVWVCLVGIWAALWPVCKFLWHKVLNTEFSAALFGAGLGALGARKIAKDTEHEKRVRDEIMGCNNAIALSASIVNTFIAVKRQNIIGMEAMYQRTWQEYVALLSNPPNQPTEFAFVTDFQSLSKPLTAIEELRRTILDHVKSSVPAVSISVPLHQSIASLSTVIDRREGQFARLRAVPAEMRILLYFGLLLPDGSLDSSYPDTLTAIFSYVDDGIYFPMLLCEVLADHAKTLAQEYGRDPPPIKTIDYKDLEGSPLLPDRKNYPDFERNFRAPKPPPEPKTLRRKIAAWWKRTRPW